MSRVLVASKTCRSTLSEEQLSQTFTGRGLMPVFKSLESLGEGESYEAVVAGTEAVDGAVMDRIRGLRCIVKFGVGTDNINQEAARARGIAVANLPGANSDSVAEMALSLILAAARRVSQGDRAVRNGKWPRFTGISLRGKTLGIVGTGSIGCGLASMVSGLQMRLVGYDLAENHLFRELGGRYLALESLLEIADVISLHLPLNSETRGLIGKQALAKVKDTVILINTARGGIVDEDALLAFLRATPQASAGLDVLEQEPPLESPLLKLENVVATPHIAASTREALETMLEQCIQTLLDNLESQEGRGDINAEAVAERGIYRSGKAGC